MQGPQAVRSWELLSSAALQLWERASPAARSREHEASLELRGAALRLVAELWEQVLVGLQQREQWPEQSPEPPSLCRQRSCG